MAVYEDQAIFTIKIRVTVDYPCY